MAKAMITLTWCDKHLSEQDVEVAADAYVWDGMQVDLCEECAVPLIAARAMFTEYGSNGPRTMKAPKAPRTNSANPVPGGIPCPHPGCASVLMNRQSLGAHARTQHGLTLGELEGKPLTETCEECGKGFTSAAGLGLHVRVKHGEPRATPRKRSAAKKRAAA